MWRGALLEAIQTFFVVWVVFATAVDARGAFTSIAGLAIGLSRLGLPRRASDEPRPGDAAVL